MYSGMKYDVTIQLSQIHCTYYREHNDIHSTTQASSMTSQCRLTCKKTLAQTNSTTISHRGLKGKGLGEGVIDRLVQCQERHCICHRN